jgi:hypothetical protein
VQLLTGYAGLLPKLLLQALPSLQEQLCQAHKEVASLKQANAAQAHIITEAYEHIQELTEKHERSQQVCVPGLVVLHSQLWCCFMPTPAVWRAHLPPSQLLLVLNCCGYRSWYVSVFRYGLSMLVCNRWLWERGCH